MRIGILGGTGDLGKGLAQRLSLHHKVMIGSREETKARSLADSYLQEVSSALGKKGEINGFENGQVIRTSDVIIIALPYNTVNAFLTQMQANFRKDQLVISPIVPMEKGQTGFFYNPYIIDGKEMSAAEVVSRALPNVESIASAFHTVPAARLADLSYKLDFDVLVASDSGDGWTRTASIVSDIEGLRPYYAGKLYLSRYLEPLTPLMLNVATNNRLKQPSLKIIAERKG